MPHRPASGYRAEARRRLTRHVVPARSVVPALAAAGGRVAVAARVALVLALVSGVEERRVAPGDAAAALNKTAAAAEKGR